MPSRAKTMLNTALCRAGGYLFFALGFVGMFLPLLPTTIFWILAAWLFARAHPEMKARIYAWPRIGPVVEDFSEHGLVKRRAKISASLGICAVGGLSIWATSLTGSAALLVVATLAAVITFIATRPESL